MPTKNDCPRQSMRVPRVVWVLGFVSLLMDISSEMIHAVLPLFMSTTLGASAVWIGLVEGIGEGGALLSKVFSGVIADRFGHKKWLVFLGYFLGVISKPIFALASSMPVVLGARLFDRIGKGIRGAPRDAIIADVTPTAIQGAAYGLRQSLDAAGAFVGPAIVTLLLLFWTDNFREIFYIAFIPGIACLLLILFGVENTQVDSEVHPAMTLSELFGVVTPALRKIIFLGVLFSLARFSNAFIVLRAADVGVATALIPMVMVLMNIAFSLSSYPFGFLSDRVSPTKLLMLGLVFLILSDVVFAAADTPYGILVGVILFGLHLGATQGIFATLVASVADSARRATAFGLFNSFSGISLLAAGLVAGLLWELYGPCYSFLGGAFFAFCTLLICLWMQYKTNTGTTKVR